MKLVELDFSKYEYPLKTLLTGNADTWWSMSAVVKDLTPQQLKYSHPGIKQRSIAEMVDHALDTQYGFYTKHLVMGEELPDPLYNVPAADASEAQQRIADTYKKMVELWIGLTKADFQKEIPTEWGQVLTGESALFQSITHTHYHVSEICFLRSLGGFPTEVLG